MCARLHWQPVYFISRKVLELLKFMHMVSIHYSLAVAFYSHCNFAICSFGRPVSKPLQQSSLLVMNGCMRASKLSLYKYFLMRLILCTQKKAALHTFVIWSRTHRLESRQPRFLTCELGFISELPTSMFIACSLQSFCRVPIITNSVLLNLIRSLSWIS